MPQNDVHVVTTGSSGAATRARRALLGVYKAVRALGTHRGKRTATVAGILRDGKRHRAAARRVTWPTVYVREAYEARGAQGEDVEANTPATLGAHLFRHAALLRTPALTYDLVVIPLRVALPEVFVGSAGALAVDVLFDVWGAIALCLDVSQPSRGANDATVGLAGKFAPPDEYGHSDGQKGAARRFRLAREVAANVAHYVGWAVFAQTHRVEVFMAAQLVRCLRMADLLAFLKAVNNDLTSNVRLLAMSKFSLILFFVPHWVACAWLLVADGWHIWDSNDMQLPSWPAQFELVTGNPLLDANEITLKQRYLFALFMSYAGLCGRGYSDLTLTRKIEIILATVVTLLHTIFYAYVLGTLFHYLVRTDENTVNFKALLKACDGFATERKLPPALAAKVSKHYRFQHSKQSSSTDRIFAQMPRTLQTEVATEQYRREIGATWAFFGCVPQFLNALALQLRERFLPPRQALFRRGDGALELSWCIDGILCVTGRDEQSFPDVRADLGPGQIVGEVAFFLSIVQPYTLAASARSEVTLVYVTTASFEEIALSYPEQVDTVVRTILRKYGLDKNGQDHATAAAALADGSRDRDEQEDFERLRESIRLVITERNEERVAQIAAAVPAGDLDTIRTLIERGLDPNVGTYDGRSALHVAAAVGHVQAAALLIELGADMEQRDRWSSTPLEVAVDRKQAAVAAQLKAKGARLELSHPASRLHGAVRRGEMDEIALLLSLGIPVSAVDHDGRSALHISAAAGNDLVAKLLISSLAEVNAQDRWGRTPLDEAIDTQRPLVINLLMRSSARPDKRRLAPLIRAAAKRADVDSVQFMLDLGVTIVDACVAMPHYDGRTGLHYAAVSGSISTVFLLVAALMDVEMADRWGRTPLVDALETTPETAALLTNTGAKLPTQLAQSAELNASLAGARSLDMYVVMTKIRMRMQGRKDALAHKVSIHRELEIALKESATMLDRVVRERAALARTLQRGVADRWIDSYGVDDDDTDSDVSSQCSSDGSDSDARGAVTPSGEAATLNEEGEKHAVLAARRFTRVTLQLPSAEEGLLLLKRLFGERLLAAAAQSVTDAYLSDDKSATYGGQRPLDAEQRRRDDEHAAMLALLIGDLGFAPDAAERTLDEIYAQLAHTLGTTPTAPHGMGLQIVVQPRLSDEDEDDESAGPGDLERALRWQRRASSSGARSRKMSTNARARTSLTGAPGAADGAAQPQRALRNVDAEALFELGLLARRASSQLDPRTRAMEARRRSLLKRNNSLVGAADAEMLGRMPTSAADARAPSMSAAPSKDAMLPTTAPVFVSQLGFSIFFTSCTFVRSLARSGTAQLARGVSDAPPGDQASASSLAGARSQFALTTDVASSASLSPCSWPSATVRLLDARAAGSEPGASSLASSATQATRSCMTNAAEKPSVPTRRSARFTQPRALPITTFAASAQQREAEAAAAADSAEKRVRTAVQRTAVVFHQLLAVFDFDAASFGEAVDDGERPAREGASAQVRLSDVRRLRLQLGESGSQQITALYEHLQRAAIALGAPIVDHEGDGVERSAERRVKEAQAREDKHARDMRSSSERPQPSASVESSDEHVATTDAEDEPPLFDAFQRRPQCEEADAPAALASPAVPARHARATLGGNEDAARLARRAKRALLNEAHFFPAVAAWILSTTADAEEEEAGAEAHSAAGAAQGSPAMPALNLHLKNPPKAHNGLFKDGAAEASPAADEATGASPPGGARLRITESDAALLEALDASLWSAEALTGIADRLAVRLESGRLLRGEAVRAEALLAIIAQAVVVPPDATARMLADVCASRLELELATDDEEGKERRTARRSLLSPEPPTWLSIERALRDAVAAGIANNAWKGGGDAAALVRQDDAAREAGLLGLSTKPWYIASVKSRGYRAAHSSFLLLASIDVLLLPLELVFIKETKTMIWLLDARIAVDAFYIARIAGSFFVSFINEKSVEITEPQACRKAYLAGNCVLDMLAAFPLNLVLMTVGVTPMQFYASRLPRVLNARYCYRRYREWLASIDDEDLFSGMLSTMFIFLLTLHLITTLVKLFGHAQFIRDMTFMTWTDLYEIRRLAVHAQRLAFRQAEAIVVDYYLVSYFQTLSLVTTVGGMPPSNIAEFALQIFIMLVSMTVYAVIVGNLSSLVMKQDDEIIAKRAQLELVQGYVRYIRVPKELKKRLTRFFQQRFKSTSLSAVPADVIYRGLPMEVQIEVSKHTNRAVIEAARILRGCSAGFVDRLSSLLKERAPEAESVIFRTAEACKELIFVAAGVIELYDDHQPGEELAITETRSFGETLGDVPFVFQVRHVHNARAAPDVETRMFVLLSTGYVDLLKTFPDMHDIVMENAIHQHEVTSRSNLKSARSAGGSVKSGRSRYADSELAGGSALGSMAASATSALAADSASRLQVILSSAKRRRAELQHMRLCFACAKGEEGKARALLSGPASDVHAVDANGRSALHLAACSGSVAIIELLVACRADVNVVDAHGSTPLIAALRAGQAIAAALLARAGGMRGPADMSAELCAAAAEADGAARLRTLAEHGCDLNAATPFEERTALHVAAASGHVESVRALLEGGASVNAKDAHGVSPLDESVRARHDAVLQLLLEHGGELCSIDMAMSLNQAVFDGDMAHLARLVRARCSVNAADDYMRTPLHLAASCKRVSAMQFLLEQEGVDLSAEDVYGATPLDDALREEKDDETKVLSTLLRSRRGGFGSRTDRTAAQTFRNAGHEEKHLAEVSARMAGTEQLLRDARSLCEWLHEQIADVRSMREAIDDAARAEETHGAVLADERPELWEQIRDFAERQRQQHEHVALDIEPMVEGWLDGLDDMAREAMLELRKGIASLLAHHDAQRETRRDPIGRLAEIAFRRPQVALATNDIGASTADMAVITTRSRVMH